MNNRSLCLNFTLQKVEVKCTIKLKTTHLYFMLIANKFQLRRKNDAILS